MDFPDMTGTLNGGAATAVVAGIQAHARLADWLKGEGIDKALKAMNVSAVAKKPGRVLKRVGKELGSVFRTPKVLGWDKERKTVHASSITKGQIADVALTMAGVSDEMAVFQTDLYFRANSEVTEVNASTVSAITVPAMEKLAMLRGIADAAELNGEAARAMTLARIFQTGLKDAGFGEMDAMRHLVPFGDEVLVALSLPIHRVEFDKELVGKFVLVVDVLGKSEIAEEDRAGIAELTHAMTREGHPGEEAFGAMISRLARPAAGEVAA